MGDVRELTFPGARTIRQDVRRASPVQAAEYPIVNLVHGGQVGLRRRLHFRGNRRRSRSPEVTAMSTSTAPRASAEWVESILGRIRQKRSRRQRRRTVNSRRVTDPAHGGRGGPTEASSSWIAGPQTIQGLSATPGVNLLGQSRRRHLGRTTPRRLPFTNLEKSSDGAPTGFEGLETDVILTVSGLPRPVPQG